MPIKPRAAAEATATTPAVTAIPAHIAKHCRRIRRAIMHTSGPAHKSLKSVTLPLSSPELIEEAVRSINAAARLARAGQPKPKSEYRRTPGRRKASKGK